MKSPTTTLKTTIAALAISAVMVLACSSTDSNETTEPQSRATQPIATLQATNVQAPQEDQPTKEVAPNNESQTSTSLPNTASTSNGNATIERPSFGTATPEAGEPIATPTQPLRQQQGGAVILAQPTPTMTPVPTPTSTPLPPSTPYWKQFSQADYDQFRPPTGPINWRTPEKCRFDRPRQRVANDVTPAGILDNLSWGYIKASTHAPISATILDYLGRNHSDLFGNPASNISYLCGNLEALHSQIPVIRNTFAINVSRGLWTNPETGKILDVLKAYRIEVRYIYTEGEDKPKLEQLGPVLIEPLGHVCNRDDLKWPWDTPVCHVPLD